ncbi:hypothetical protein PO909_019139 [Leuciscus waleckii]
MQPLLAVKSPHAHRGQIFTDAKDPGCAQLAASKLQWSFAWLNTSTASSIHQSLHFVSADFIQDPAITARGSWRRHLAAREPLSPHLHLRLTGGRSGP